MFRLQNDRETFRLEYPLGAFDQGRLAAAVASLLPGTEATRTPAGDGRGLLELRSPSGEVGGAALRMFANLNGYPCPPPSALVEFRNAEDPLVSCILLLPFNDLFARNVVLPGIIASSRGRPIEIIMVSAGFGVDLRPFRGLRVIESEMASIARGYNLGVREARGEYVALFHDDCLLDDPRWIDKCLDALHGDVLCVVAEFDRWFSVPVGKAVPLVMRREDFLEVGGYDEFYYAGVEDLDFGCAVRARGREQGLVELDALHLRGMGSSLIVHDRPNELKRLFGYQVLPREEIRSIHAGCMRTLVSHGFIRLLEASYHLHFLDKYGEQVADRFGADVAALRDAYKQMRRKYLSIDGLRALSSRPFLLELFRGLMNADDLAAPVE